MPISKNDVVMEYQSLSSNVSCPLIELLLDLGFSDVLSIVNLEILLDLLLRESLQKGKLWRTCGGKNELMRIRESLMVARIGLDS